ncbi:alanine--tRNA ligase [bacterium]|nr:alanine--tRNA ligase [bacterium]
MKAVEIREKFLKFFEKNGHTIVPSSSLIPTDPSVLLTTAGMQQFKDYFLGKLSPYGNRVTSCQKSFRTSDIEEVGDERHLTFFEMIGNFSFGDYFKEETIKLARDFIFNELNLDLEECYFTVFEGDDEVPFDLESFDVLKKLGVPEEKIKKMPRGENFWGPTGAEGPCGPTVEIYCRDLEIWNLVFNEYFMDKDNKLTPLKQRGVDTGAGLERVALIMQRKESVFETDLFEPIMSQIVVGSEVQKRIIADHIKSSVFLISDGVLPSNKERGYILRRLIRRMVGIEKYLEIPTKFILSLVPSVLSIYKDVYPELKEEIIVSVFEEEIEKFEQTLEKGLKQFEKIIEKGDISGIDAFHLYDTYGFPLDLTIELAQEKNLKVDKTGFENAFEKHQEISRAGVEKKFGGVGKGVGEEEAKLHTATHLLHQALRTILGDHIQQMGSDINSERLRFDFSHSAKLTEEEIKKVENLINQKIEEDLIVEMKEMLYKDAVNEGALAFFKNKYPEKVNVYSIGDFSKEICGGPHVKRLSELGKFKIIKEESSSAGVRRIKALLEQSSF